MTDMRKARLLMMTIGTMAFSVYAMDSWGAVGSSASDGQTSAAATQRQGPRKAGAKSRGDADPTSAPAQALARLARIADVHRDIVYKTVGKRDLLLDVYAPKGKSGPHPTVVFIHGGGWRSGTKDNLFSDRFMGVVEPLLVSGVQVVSIDYRLSGDGALARDMVADCKDAMRWLRKNADKCGVDLERVGLWGPSAGGHLVLMVGLTKDDQFVGDPALAPYPIKVRFIDSWFGPTDMASMAAKSRVGAEGFSRLVGTPAQDTSQPVQLVQSVQSVQPAQPHDRYAEISPMTYLGKGAPAILLCHGERDSTVPISQSQELYDKGRQMGLDVTLMIVRNAAHNFRATGEVAPSLEEIQAQNVEFIRKHLGLPAESGHASHPVEEKP